MNNLASYVIKSVIIGDKGVGKTTLSKRISQENVSYNEISTVGIDFFSVNVFVNETPVKLQIWDTAGDERFLNLIKIYLKYNAICYIVYDVTNEQSFNNAQKWIDLFKNETLNSKTIMVVVANKIDKIKRVVSSNQGKEFATKNNALYIETTCKMSQGINCMIYEPIEQILKLYNEKIINTSDEFGFKNAMIVHNNHKKKCCSIQ